MTSKATARHCARYALSPRARYLGLTRADGSALVPTVLRATILPAAVLRYFNGRGERELISEPGMLHYVAAVLRPRLPDPARESELSEATP
jgi:hypothetical protein